MISCTIFFLVFLLISTDCAVLRHRRQAQTSVKRPPSDEMIKILRSFVPQPHPSCPENFMACRDNSFCFSERELCGKTYACDDVSDDFNAICLGTLPPVSTAPEITTKSISSSTDLSSQTIDSTSYNNFGNPLVVAFIVLVCGLFVYVSLATYCWVTNRWNVVNPERMTS